LSWGSTDVPTLLAEVTQAQEAVVAAEATRVEVVLTVETSTREVVAAWDNIVVCVEDAEG
jgi:hypothetical protein